MTDAERRLWRELRLRQLSGCKFRRQHPIGHYVLDFVCLEKKLVVEVDGGQHADQIPYDHERTTWLEANGFRVLRFWNNDVFGSTEGVVEAIQRALNLNEPSPS